MDKALRPDRFEGIANTSTSAKEFTHWLKTFEHYVDVLPQDNLDKLKLLTNYVSPTVYDYFSECGTYTTAIEALKKVYIKPSNEVFARHTLATRKQKPGETIDEFLQALITLSKDCNFVAVSAEQNRSNAIRDAFITGLQSNAIRQRLLENKSLTLDTTLDQARSLDSAQKNVESYSNNNNPSQFAAAISNHDENFEQQQSMHVNQISKDPTKCWNCGNNRHPRSTCPARDVQCNKCNRKGHFGNFCRSSSNNNRRDGRNSDGRNNDGRNSDGRNGDGRNGDGTVCQVCKPQFYKPPTSYLIKSTQPFQRLNIDFKGPVPSASPNKYMLTVVDEFSRFPFAFPCRDVSAQTVIMCLNQLFAIFGMPAYTHSDRGSSFMSAELKGYLHSKGIATSRTTPYNPEGNGQCERYNGIVWRTITLALKSRNLPVTHWESVLPDALHSIRSLICTSTNVTPHERLFNYQRRSTTGQSVPSWLTTPGPVLIKRHVRNSKYDPLVDEAELIEANP